MTPETKSRGLDSHFDNIFLKKPHFDNIYGHNDTPETKFREQKDLQFESRGI